MNIGRNHNSCGIYFYATPDWGIPGWIGATAAHDIEVVIYPEFAKKHLNYVGAAP